MRNPYLPGSVFKEPLQFYGREQLIEELLTFDSQAYYLKGNRRIGKTFVLRFLEKHLLSQSNCLPIYLSLQGSQTVEAMGKDLEMRIEEVLKTLRLEPISFSDGHDFIAIIRVFQRYGKDQGHYCFLLLDEAEELLHLKNRELAALRRVLLDEYDNLKVIITATGKLQELYARKAETSNFLNGFIPKYLGCLNREIAERLVRQMKWENGPLPVREESMKEIIRYAGTHPFLLQRLCYNLFEQGQLRNITAADLVLDQMLMHFFQNDFDSLNQAQQQVLHCFSFEQPRILAEITQQSTLRQSTVHSALVELENLGFLRSEGGKYYIGNYFLAQWLEEQRNQTALASEIKKPIQVFISYAHKDRKWKNKLRKHLAILEHNQKITIWEDSHLRAGQEWQKEIESQLRKAKVFLFLVSADLLDSCFVMNTELPMALEHQKEGALVIPVIVRSCFWAESDFSKLQALPQDGKAIQNYEHPDDAMSEIAKKIKDEIMLI